MAALLMPMATLILSPTQKSKTANSGRSVVRLEYKKKNMAFEFEIGREKTVTSSPTQDEETNRDFFSIGYRIDF